jgi:Zn-dependent M28 family amino/carboxypeptidase
MEKFIFSPFSLFESLKIFCAGYYLSLILYWVSVPAALILSLINSGVFFTHFLLFKNYLEKIFPKSESLNVIGVIEPQKEPITTIILSGHTDSVYEFYWWYKLKTFGMILSILGGVAITFLPLLYILIFFLNIENNLETGWPLYVWLLFMFLAPTTITLFSITRGRRPVDGAQDNLAGTAIAMAVGESLVKGKKRKKSFLKHTRIKIISFGAEETGLNGSRAYVKKNLDSIIDEKSVLINIDGIIYPDQLHIISREYMTGARYNQELIRRVENSFIHCGLPSLIEPISIGATDAASFACEDIPALTIIGQSPKILDPSYHTRLDTAEYINPKALTRLRDVLIHFVKEWDRQYS